MKEVFGRQTNVDPQCADAGPNSPRSLVLDINLLALVVRARSAATYLQWYTPGTPQHAMGSALAAAIDKVEGRDAPLQIRLEAK